MFKFVEVDLNLFPVSDIMTEKTDEDIGYIELAVETDYVYVADIEIYSKLKGHGRLVITELLAKHKKITGHSLYSAIGFWKKMGAIFLKEPEVGRQYSDDDIGFEFVITQKRENDKMNLF